MPAATFSPLMYISAVITVVSSTWSTSRNSPPALPTSQRVTILRVGSSRS